MFVIRLFLSPCLRINIFEKKEGWCEKFFEEINKEIKKVLKDFIKLISLMI